MRVNKGCAYEHQNQAAEEHPNFVGLDNSGHPLFRILRVAKGLNTDEPKVYDGCRDECNEMEGARCGEGDAEGGGNQEGKEHGVDPGLAEHPAERLLPHLVDCMVKRVSRRIRHKHGYGKPRNHGTVKRYPERFKVKKLHHTKEQFPGKALGNVGSDVVGKNGEGCKDTQKRAVQERKGYAHHGNPAKKDDIITKICLSVIEQLVPRHEAVFYIAFIVEEVVVVVDRRIRKKEGKDSEKRPPAGEKAEVRPHEYGYRNHVELPFQQGGPEVP